MGSMAKKTSKASPDLVLQSSQLSGRPLELALQSLLTNVKADEGSMLVVHALDTAGQHSALMGLSQSIRVNVGGDLGDFACAYNQAAKVMIRGNVGNGVGDGMTGGAVRVYGRAGDGVGVAMSGGTLAVYGHAGNSCGAAMCGGEIFVRGDVGSQLGVGARRGTIVVGGNAGARVGEAIGQATIYIRGEAESLAPGVVETGLRERERLRLGLLLINAAIKGDANEFRRIVPKAIYEEEKNRPRGEIDPSWR